MAAPASYSLSDLMLAFYANALGLPALSPVFNAAGQVIGITDSTDTILNGNITALNANLATGVATVGSTIVFPAPLVGVSNLSIQVTGAFVATLVIQVSNDNINWVQLAGVGIQNVNNQNPQASITAVGTYIVNIASFAYVRITCSAFTSGNAAVFMKVSDTPALVSVGGPLPTGTNTIGKAIITGSTSMGMTIAKLLSAATTNATSLKASAGTLCGGTVSNNSAAVKFLHLYNKASAPTVGTDSPAFTILLPVGVTTLVDLGPVGGSFATGIAYSITGAAGDLDATVTAVNDVSGVLVYV